jgi:hypothetical protein
VLGSVRAIWQGTGLQRGSQKCSIQQAVIGERTSGHGVQARQCVMGSRFLVLAARGRGS